MNENTNVCPDCGQDHSEEPVGVFSARVKRNLNGRSEIDRLRISERAGAGLLLPYASNDGRPGLSRSLAVRVMIDTDAPGAVSVSVMALNDIPFGITRYGPNEYELHPEFEQTYLDALIASSAPMPEGYKRLIEFVDDDGDAVTLVRDGRVYAGTEARITVDVDAHNRDNPDAGTLRLWLGFKISNDFSFDGASIELEADGDSNPFFFNCNRDDDIGIMVMRLQVNLSNGVVDALESLPRPGDDIQRILAMLG